MIKTIQEITGLNPQYAEYLLYGLLLLGGYFLIKRLTTPRRPEERMPADYVPQDNTRRPRARNKVDQPKDRRKHEPVPRPRHEPAPRRKVNDDILRGPDRSERPERKNTDFQIPKKYDDNPLGMPKVPGEEGYTPDKWTYPSPGGGQSSEGPSLPRARKVGMWPLLIFAVIFLIMIRRMELIPIVFIAMLFLGRRGRGGFGGGRGMNLLLRIVMMLLRGRMR